MDKSSAVSNFSCADFPDLNELIYWLTIRRISSDILAPENFAFSAKQDAVSSGNVTKYLFDINSTYVI
jgi:hypothetical protein